MTGHVTGEELEAWTRRALIDERELQAYSELADVELARRFNGPAEQVTTARKEMCGGPMA